MLRLRKLGGCLPVWCTKRKSGDQIRIFRLGECFREAYKKRLCLKKTLSTNLEKQNGKCGLYSMSWIQCNGHLCETSKLKIMPLSSVLKSRVICSNPNSIILSCTPYTNAIHYFTNRTQVSLCPCPTFHLSGWLTDCRTFTFWPKTTITRPNP